VFAPEDRERLRDALVAAARADDRVTAAALVGSSAAGEEDRWSDVDLALAVAGTGVIDDWTARMYAEHGALHHVDVRAAALYRVFLLDSTLQVDVSFWPPERFGPTSPRFRLLFGTAREPPAPSAPSAEEPIGLAWLYALHVRSSLARGRRWQAEYMLGHARDQALALACLRRGLPAREARGADRLPADLTAPLERGLPGSLEPAELRRAFRAVIEWLVAEIEQADPALAGRLGPALRSLAGAEMIGGVGPDADQ
jgi:predicted nucleotidyltransferase